MSAYSAYALGGGYSLVAYHLEGCSRNGDFCGGPVRYTISCSVTLWCGIFLGLWGCEV